MAHFYRTAKRGTPLARAFPTGCAEIASPVELPGAEISGRIISAFFDVWATAVPEAIEAAAKIAAAVERFFRFIALLRYGLV